MGLDGERLARCATLVLLTPVPSWPLVWICMSALEAASLGWSPSSTAYSHPAATSYKPKLSKLQCAHLYAHVCAQSWPTLWDSADCSPLGSSVHRILQARILEWVAISSCRGSSRPRDQPRISCISCIDRQILYHCHLGSPIYTRE